MTLPASQRFPPLPPAERRDGFTVTVHQNDNVLDVDIAIHTPNLEFVDCVPVAKDWIAAYLKNSLNDHAIRELTAQLAASSDRLALSIEEATNGAIAFTLSAFRKRDTSMAAPQSIADLTSQVATTVSVEGSAAVLINGFQARLDAGIEAALAGGATAAELAPLSTLSTDLKTSTDALAASVATGTPAAPPPAA
jgi:hypothetical protein